MRKLTVTVVVGLVVAMLGAGLVYWYGSRVDERIADGKETTPVLVTKKDLAVGTPSSALEPDVETRQIPRAYVPAGAVQRLEDLAGLVLLGPLPAQTQLNKLQFGSPAEVALVEPSQGNIALAVQVGISPGVARYVRVGSFVDIFVTYSGGGAIGGQTGAQSVANRRTKLFLSNIRVLAVSIAEQTTEQQQQSDQGGVAGRVGTTGSQVIAVLDLTAPESERVVNAVTLGELYLGLSKTKHTTPTGVVPEDVITSNR